MGTPLALGIDNSRLAYGLADAAYLIGVCPSTLRGLIRKGSLPVARIGDRVLIRREDLERLLEPKR